mmetsp:Transcript_26851/g.55727  ORF Transcript_26851/g.55727 Transcript_26851/m.55727 type:complete len:119 (-) Transcript_26851:2-358(-)
MYRRPSAAAVRVSLKTSWRSKMEIKERKAALRAVVRTLSERAVRAREEERLRLQARRRIKLENRFKAQQFQQISSAKKIAQMTKKKRRKLKAVADVGPAPSQGTQSRGQQQSPMLASG